MIHKDFNNINLFFILNMSHIINLFAMPAKQETNTFSFIEKMEGDVKNLPPTNEKGLVITYNMRVRTVFINTISDTRISFSISLYIKHSTNSRVIRQVTLSSPCLWASFHPLSPLSVVSTKEGHFIKSQYEMLQLDMKC
jgi:hypothetical protein